MRLWLIKMCCWLCLSAVLYISMQNENYIKSWYLWRKTLNRSQTKLINYILGEWTFRLQDVQASYRRWYNWRWWFVTAVPARPNRYRDKTPSLRGCSWFRLRFAAGAWLEDEDYWLRRYHNLDGEAECPILSWFGNKVTGSESRCRPQRFCLRLQWHNQCNKSATTDWLPAVYRGNGKIGDWSWQLATGDTWLKTGRRQQRPVR